MSVGSLLLQCLLAGVIFDSQLVLTAAQQDYRLTGGSTQYEGTVEVFRNGEWQTVCNDGWGLTEGNLVCRLLGYGPAIAAYTDAADRFGEGAGNIWVKDWECTGRENSLEECPSGFIVFCLNSEAAGVLCRQPTSTTTTPTPSTATPTILPTSSTSSATVSFTDTPAFVWYIAGGVGGSVILFCLCFCVCIMFGVCCYLGKLDSFSNVITYAQFDIVLVCCVLGLKLEAKCSRVPVERFGLHVVRWSRSEDTLISFHQKHTRAVQFMANQPTVYERLYKSV